MSEFISKTPETETSAERFFWDNILRTIDTLSDLSDEVGLYETIDGLRDETEEDALMLVYNYTVMVEVPEGESSALEHVEDLLREYGIIEDSRGDDDEV